MTATTLSARRGVAGEFATFVPADGDACVKLQGVAAGDGGAHIDLMVAEVAPFVSRALELGRLLLQRLGSDRPLGAHLDLACGGGVAAVRSWHESLGATFEAPGDGWLVMRDPTGGVYCLTARDPEAARLPG